MVQSVATYLTLSEERCLRALSLWWDGLPAPFVSRPVLGADVDVDVAVVGAGFTGLWTAYYLLRASPGLRVALLEKEVTGFGASGRNGGWCSALFPVPASRIARQHGADAARAMRRAMQGSVDEVGVAVTDDSIDCRFVKGGSIVAARNGAQVERAGADLAEARAFGLSENDLLWLSKAEAGEICGAAGVLGATYTPHCAVLDPARLVRGLAESVERRGGSIYERTRVEGIAPGDKSNRPRLRANGVSVRADFVVRAAEAWAPALTGDRRSLLPLYSLMIATEPLTEQFWAEAGLARRETFSDYRELVIYGQRTSDGRLAFGGRGAPYHFASSVRPSYDRAPRVHASLHRALVQLFPSLRDVSVTHAWGGPLGVPRDWFASVGLDRRSGVGWAGGYVGDGVSTSNLAGRTVTDLVLGRDTDLVHLPWVGHRSRKWGPEPLRWLEVNGALQAIKLVDHAEERWRASSAVAGYLERLLGS